MKKESSNHKKTEIYIDFEAITNPFAKMIGLKSGTPYCYTLGIKNNFNVIKTHTFVSDFKKSDYMKVMREAIIRDINRIDNTIKMSEVIFVGHNPVLEKKIIKELFPNNEVKPLLSHATVSLDLITHKDFNQPYFTEVRNAILSNTKNNVLENKFVHDGSLASFVGCLLFCMQKQRKIPFKRYNLEISRQTVLKELKQYSKDDVLKMFWIDERRDDIDEMIKLLNHKKEFLKLLNQFQLEDSMTIKELKEKIWDI
ncbi:hypothetical protein [Mycoplasma sp. 4044]